MTKPDIREILEQRIMIIDGSMGALIMSDNPTEEGYRGERFKNHHIDVRNATDLLVLTQPELISGIHRKYLDAGADIIETDTFNASIVGMKEFELSHIVRELNQTGAELARKCADEYTAKTSTKPRYVAGSIGPTNVRISQTNLQLWAKSRLGPNTFAIAHTSDGVPFFFDATERSK